MVCVLDRALLYYRLLLADVDICRQLFVGEALCAVPGGQFAELSEDELRRRLFEEFNSLAVVYGMPSNRFVKARFQLVTSSPVLHCLALCGVT